jgi:spermidine synthase
VLTPRAGGPTRAAFATIAALYFASGAVGLVDEVIFFKYLSLSFGATAYASSAVLVAFMGGLALGAALAARFDAHIARPLIVYGALEVAVGVACAVSPQLFAAVGHAYVAVAPGISSLAALHLARGALAGAVVLVPTIAMGATLPLVARVAGASAGGDRRVAWLYGLNTAGGAVGSLLGTYLIVPGLGLSTSLRAGACISVGIGVTAMAIAGRLRASGPANEAEEAEEEAPGASPPAPRAVNLRPIWIAAAASGLLVFASEVVFVHLLALVAGTSVYVFGLVLCVFLVALSAGASASRVLARRAGEAALSTSLAITALALAISIPFWDRLPELFVRAGPYVASWPAREAVRGIVAALAIGLPATCMGTTFPLVLASLAPLDDRGRQVGRATAINTIAAIAGSLVGGFALLPWLGSQRALGCIAVAYGATALAVGAPRRRTGLVLAIAAAVAVAVAPRWDLARLASGTNVYFERQPEQGRVVWIDEDVHGGIVTVTLEGARHTLWTNGKYQGDDGFQMQAQLAFAEIPAMFVPRFDRALVVGVGTGTTIGALARYPFGHVDVAELSPGIIAAARTFFGSVNEGALDNPRFSVRLEDGRNLLLVGRAAYDLVTIELTSIWFAGAGNLYNREFYQVAAGRLTPGGVLSQWIQLHHTTLREIASQMATARTVFPHAAFFVRGDQGFLELGLAPLVARPHAPADTDDLVLADDTLDRFVDDVVREAGTTRDAIVSTDDNLRLEYATPRNNVPGRPSPGEMAATLRKWRVAEVAQRVGAR